MIAALNRLKAMHEPAQLPDQMAAFGISGSPAGGFKRLFMSHPPLDERIVALKQARCSSTQKPSVPWHGGLFFCRAGFVTRP